MIRWSRRTPRARASSTSFKVSTARPFFCRSLVVGDLRRQPPFSPISIVSLTLSKRRCARCAWRDVDAAHASRRLRQLDDFSGRRDVPGRRRVPSSSRTLPFPCPTHEPAHLLELRAVALRLIGPMTSSRTVPCRRTYRSWRHLERRHAIEKRLDRHRRRAVRPFHDGGHPLPYVIVGPGHLKDAAAGMRMEIDEAGRDDFACGVYRARCWRVNPRRDARDGVAAHGDVGAVPRTPGSVDKPAVLDEEVVDRRLCARYAGQNEETDESGGREGGSHAAHYS